MPLTYLSRHLPETIILAVVAILQMAGLWMLLRTPGSAARRRWILTAAAGSLMLLCIAFLLQFARVMMVVPRAWAALFRGAAFAWAAISAVWVVEFAVWRGIALVLRTRAPRPVSAKSDSPGQNQEHRRDFLRVGSVMVAAAPVAVLAYGTFIERRRLGLHEVTVSFSGLPRDLDGVRIAQLTDIHLSAFLSESELAHAVELLNETKPHLSLVTGDLITSRGDPLDACLSHVAQLRAEAGVYGCLGNHEAYAEAEDYVERQAALAGIRFLRSTREKLRFGDSILNLAGVDYQPFHSKPYLAETRPLVEPGALNVLLSHNPDVFPVAARQGYALTIGGHTHGGQVNFEILKQNLNVARFYTPYTRGLYQEGGSALYVSRGLGTIGLPTRLGAPPEVTLLTLRGS